MNSNKPRILIISFLFLIFFSAQGVENDSIATQFQNKVEEAKGDSIQLCDVYYDYAVFLSGQGDMEASIEKFNDALHIAKNMGAQTKVASVGNRLANMYAAMGNFKASNETYMIALEAAKKIKNSGEIAKISMNLASNYNYTGDYEKAIKHGLYALGIKERAPNLERICYHYIAMGNIFRENNNTVKWEEYVQKAYKMKDVEGCASLGDIAKIYNSLGGIEVQKEEFEKALLYYDTLLTLSREAEYDLGISAALTNSAGVYKQEGDVLKALDLANEAEQYFGENPYEIIFNNSFKAELYQQEGQYEKALELANQNINIEEISSYSTEKLKCLLLLYELNFALSNYEEAYFWNDSLRSAEQNLRDEDIRQSMEDLETKYETEKKVQQIELLTAENSLKNQRLNAGMGIVGILLVVIFLITYILNIRKKQAALVQNDLQQKVLRSQMNPHFIFNVLGSIQNFMLRNDTREASKFLSQFASLIRATLNNSAAETISLADEIDMLRDYIELELMRSPDKFDYQIDIEDKLEVDFIQIPPMLIQPFVENSIKHGFEGLDRKGLLKLSICDRVSWLEIVVEDNGSGLRKENSNEKEYRSMATEIFEKRRKLIQHKYKKDFSFESLNLSDLIQGESGVKVIINIPVLNND
ncbi:MAG: histidine kinase [Bacteroides sp.]|nr:histidine kinase [Bacteroides sp.]